MKDQECRCLDGRRINFCSDDNVDYGDGKEAGCLLPVISWSNVAHGSVDGDGPDVEASHHHTHLLPVIETVVSPQQSSLLLRHNTGGKNINIHKINLPTFYKSLQKHLYQFPSRLKYGEGKGTKKKKKRERKTKKNTSEESSSSSGIWEQFCINQGRFHQATFKILFPLRLSFTVSVLDHDFVQFFLFPPTHA